MSEYQKADFPWTFYFNGLAMPKWGANWPSFARQSRAHWDWEVGPRDLHLITAKIHHVGSVESAGAHVFLYAVQEMLCILFTERRAVLDQIRRWPHPPESAVEVYDGLVAAAFEMRELTRRDGVSMWISGYEADRLNLVEAMRRTALPANDPEYQPPPHVQSRLSHLGRLWNDQIKTLRETAASAKLNQEHRKKLQEL
jgi:hypothetical protein